MSKVSLKEIIEDIITIVSEEFTDSELVAAEYTFNFAPDNAKAKDFPRLFLIANENITIGERTNTIPITMRFCDVVGSRNNAIDKDKEIKSDMIQAASKLFDILQDRSFFDGDLTISLAPFDYEMNNSLSGVDATPNFFTDKPCFNI